MEEDVTLHRAALESAIRSIVEYLKEHHEITVSAARDYLDTNRKVAVALLETMDKKGITRREDDIRRLV